MKPRAKIESTNAPKCPQCGKFMRLHTNSKTGEKFYGCSNFPNCRGYKPFHKNAQVGKLIENPSQYQKNVFEWIEYGGGNAVVEAVAGSGKTSTMVHAASLFPSSADSVFLAFNKHIAEELGAKLPGHVTCGTMHSLCLRSLRESFGFIEIDSSKSRNLSKAFVEKVVPDSDMDRRRELINRLVRMITMAKSILIDPLSDSEIDTMLVEYNIDFSSEQNKELAKELLPHILNRCAEEKNLVDFDDMIWFIHAHNLSIKQYDWVVVDEAQDLNNLQMSILLKMVKPSGRIIAVGDRAQSIYGFRGANCHAIPLLIEKLNATVLPLSICYRCPSRHIELAKELVPQIECADNAIPGVIERYQYSEVLNQLKDGDLVLCRANAPLVSLCFSLIERGQKATIKGRDIGLSLIEWIESMKANSIAELLTKLQEYTRRECIKLEEKNLAQASQNLKDRLSMVETIAMRPEMKHVNMVTNFISSLFQDEEKPGVTCSSVHKAKGLEADSVYLLYPHLMPSKYARTEEEIQQEQNIQYVALTRSKKFLGFVLQDSI